jgi:hypothetical protein
MTMICPSLVPRRSISIASTPCRITWRNASVVFSG